MSKLYTVCEVAERYQIAPYTVRTWIRLGKLPAVKLGRDYRISEENLQKFEDDRNTIAKS